MLTLQGTSRVRLCDGLARRDFLKSAPWPGGSRAFRCRGLSKAEESRTTAGVPGFGKAKSCILVAIRYWSTYCCT